MVLQIMQLILQHMNSTPVKTAEQLAKIGSGETVNVDGMDYEYNIDTNYKLIDDIDLSGINWTLIRNEIKGYLMVTDIR